MALFRKPPQKFTVNDTEVWISPLKAGTLLEIQNLSESISEAFAKLRNTIINDYEKIIDTDAVKDGKLMQKEIHKAPEISAVSLMIKNRQDGIKALFDCFFKNSILEEILLTSVDKFNAVPKGQLFDPHSNNAIDVPTALELFGHIMEVNAGGFAALGKFSSLLGIFQGAVKQPAETKEAKLEAAKS